MQKQKSESRPSRRAQKKLEKKLKFLVEAPVVLDRRWPFIPASLKRECKLAMIESLDVENATDVEAMAVVSTASMGAPLDRDWYQIYMYLFKRWLTGKGVELPDFVADAPDELPLHCTYQLNDLKRAIRRSQKK